MTKKRSSLITHEGEINGCGNITYLKASKNEHYAPLSQGNVSPERNFSNATSVAQGFNPVVNDPQNLNSITQLTQGFVAAANRVVVSNDSTGMFRCSTMLNEQNITDDSNIQQASLKSNQNTTGITNEQWVPFGNPSGAKWKYYENGNPVSNRWVEYNGGWYYLDADQYMVTGWKELSGKWYYLKTNIIGGVEKDGKMALGWLLINNNWYYFKEEGSAGYMVTGWRQIDGIWYYFKTKAEAENGNDYGYMFSKRWLEYEGEWYYFNNNGEMVTSELINWKGKKYYLKSDGTMAKNEEITDAKTGKKYQTDEDGICQEIQNDIIKITLKDSVDFVKIVDEKEDKDYYGGDQSWYDWDDDDEKTNIAVNGGCGTVAAANIVAYMAHHNAKYKKLYAYPDYTKDNFILHMEDMYQYVTPRHIGGIPLGVWPISMLEDGVIDFAGDKGIKLKAIRKHETFNLENITKYIKEGLENDSPVAMLIGTNAIDDVTITYFDGSSGTQAIYLHWVTITEISIDKNTKTVKVKVSTWGGWAELDLDEYLGEWVYAGILYFV